MGSVVMAPPSFLILAVCTASLFFLLVSLVTGLLMVFIYSKNQLLLLLILPIFLACLVTFCWKPDMLYKIMGTFLWLQQLLLQICRSQLWLSIKTCLFRSGDGGLLWNLNSLGGTQKSHWFSVCQAFSYCKDRSNNI